MRRTIMLLFCIVLMMCLLSSVVYAHPGKTDGNGGHYDRDSGEYHYHHGYPAHSHTNGECPYNFDDKTDHTTDNSNSNNSSIEDTLTVPQKAKSKTPIWKNIVGIGFGVLICSPLILSFLFFIYYKILSPVVEYLKKKLK